MNPACETPFEKFVVQCTKDLRRIAAHTRGEFTFQDVVNEAWLLAADLHARKHMEVDFLSREFQQLLLSHLYQHLVRYTELNVRHAIQLDHGVRGGEDEPHPLMRILASGEGSEPLAELLRREAENMQDSSLPDVHHSLAAAYANLLRHFDNNMREVAEHLLISLSYAYRRCAFARRLAEDQKPLSIRLRGKSKVFLPGPWRGFQLPKAPVQLPLEFCEETLF